MPARSSRDFSFKAKTNLTSEFNMGAYYLEFLCKDIMTEIAIRSDEARKSPSFRSVERYYSMVRELFNQAESVWNKKQSEIIEKMLNEIKDKINLKKRELSVEPIKLVYSIELIQRAIYNLIRQYNMLVPISISHDSKEEKLRMLSEAFGVKYEGNSEDS